MSYDPSSPRRDIFSPISATSTNLTTLHGMSDPRLARPLISADEPDTSGINGGRHTSRMPEKSPRRPLDEIRSVAASCGSVSPFTADQMTRNTSHQCQNGDTYSVIALKGIFVNLNRMSNMTCRFQIAHTYRPNNDSPVNRRPSVVIGYESAASRR